MRRIAITASLGVVLLTLTMVAQSKPPATFADFGQWEALAQAGSRGGFSPNGDWLAYAINRSNRNNELRIVKLADGTTKVAAFGAQPVFSRDSRWVAYSIGQSETEQEKLRSEQKPVQNKLGLLNLTTGEMTTLDAIESFAFSGDGGYLAIRPYGPERAPGQAAGAPGGGRGGRGGGAAQADGEEAPGTTLIVRQLASGRDMSFGNVSQFAWQDSDRGHLLAMAISAPGKMGNGVQLLDPETNSLRVLDSSGAIYTGLAWRRDALDLAVLRASSDERKDGPTHAVLAWTSIGKGERIHSYDPSSDSKFPAGMRTVSFRRLSWSDDGLVVFAGIAKWEDKIGPAGRGSRPTPPTASDDPSGHAQAPRPAALRAADEPAAVEVWHWNDAVVMPKQKVDAPNDRRRNMLAAWHLDTAAFVPLGRDSVNEQVTPIRHRSAAWAAEWSAYAMSRSIGRPASDLYIVDTADGARTKIRDRVIDRYVQAGPAGKYLAFVQDDQYWTVNLATRAVTNLTKAVQTSFIDKESDQTVAQKPPFGFAGWTKDDAAVLLYDKFDVWQIASDGSKAQRLTSGAAEQVRHRIVRLDPDEEWIDLTKPVYVSLYGEWTKKSGYGRMEPGGSVTRLVWADKNVGSLAKASHADRFAYVSQDFDDSPDLFVGGPDLHDAKQLTTTNPFQASFAWGRSELVDYKTDKGMRLQGALYYPAGYEPGKQYPLIVYMYEKLSQNVHRYVAPSDRDYYNKGVFTSLGYFVFEPDIVFTPRQPGVSVVQCVLPGVKRVLQTGMIDPKRVGAVGHSWGGFDAAFLAANTQGVFAAAVAGAPLTDLVSMYGEHHWGPGIAETDHIETGQERMVVPVWEDLPNYVTNSALFTVHKMTVPLLLEEGDADWTVFWHQSVEMYNVARRAGKNVVFLVYNGEDHGLRQKKNQTDYQRRILAWFGHYLKGDPAERWITNGQTFLDRDAEVKKATASQK